MTQNLDCGTVDTTKNNPVCCNGGSGGSAINISHQEGDQDQNNTTHHHHHNCDELVLPCIESGTDSDASIEDNHFLHCPTRSIKTDSVTTLEENDDDNDDGSLFNWTSSSSSSRSSIETEDRKTNKTQENLDEFAKN